MPPALLVMTIVGECFAKGEALLQGHGVEDASAAVVVLVVPAVPVEDLPWAVGLWDRPLVAEDTRADMRMDPVQVLEEASPVASPAKATTEEFSSEHGICGIAT